MNTIHQFPTDDQKFNVCHCVKSIGIQSYTDPYFPAFGPNNSEYVEFSRSVYDTNVVTTAIPMTTCCFKIKKTHCT